MDLLDKAAISEGDDSFSKISEKSGDLENEDHIFFGCIMARCLDQACFKEALGWDRVPYNLQDFFDEWLPLKMQQVSCQVVLFCYGFVVYMECQK